MDYKALLAKYINHVVEQEGTDFIDWEGVFTPEESAALKDLSEGDYGTGGYCCDYVSQSIHFPRPSFQCPALRKKYRHKPTGYIATVTSSGDGHCILTFEGLSPDLFHLVTEYQFDVFEPIDSPPGYQTGILSIPWEIHHK